MTQRRQVSASVPGKVMLAGEYTVLHGGEALAVTVALDLVAQVSALPTGTIAGCRVLSDLWDEVQEIQPGTPATAFPTSPLLAAVARGMELYGIKSAEVSIRSALPLAYGIGSSSALRLAVLSAMQDFARQEQQLPTLSQTEHLPVAREALALQRAAQRQASGYDIATQLYGGLVQSGSSEDLASWPTALSTQGADTCAKLARIVHVYVGGMGAPTTPVMTSTSEWLEGRDAMAQLARLNSALQQSILATLSDTDLDKDDAKTISDLATAAGAQRRFLTESPHFPKSLAAQLTALPGCDQSWSFKTTGAGGEDALLVFGRSGDIRAADSTLRSLGWHPMPASFIGHGLRLSRSLEFSEAPHGS